MKKLTPPQLAILKSLVETGDARAHNPHVKGFGGAWLAMCRKGLIDNGLPTAEGVAALNAALETHTTLRPTNMRKVGDFGRTSELRGLTKDERAHRIDLGLAIARLHARPGVPMSLQLLAEFCGCTDGTILMYEQNALKKLRKRLNPELAAFFNR